MKTHTLTEYRPDLAPAYVANGFVGLRVGKNPLRDGSALLNGYMGQNPLEKIEGYAPVPYPVGGDIRINHLWFSQRPDLLQFREQSYDFSCGELTTKFDFTVNDVTAHVEILTFCCRSLPTITAQEVRVTVDQPCNLTLRGQIDPTGVPGRSLSRRTPNTGWMIADGVFHWESAGEYTTCGAAYITTFQGADVQPKRDHWGHASAIFTDYTVQAQPGQTYVLQQLGSLVPGIMHKDPDLEAIRLVNIAWRHGFDGLRAENRAAWVEIWKGRVKLLGAGERWQDIADAAYFYLHSSVHPSAPCSVGPWGLSQWSIYSGHVFWDCETFTFPPLLLTAPHAARAILDYRSRMLQSYRYNAALNGYRGVQMPWQSGTHGGEVLAAWASAIFLEQHISLDVAFAFAQYMHATNDESFMHTQAWPIIEGVAEWISSRVTETERGYEILHITGIDEEIEDVNNNAYTNIAAIVILKEAMGLAERLGYTAPERWADITERMFLPIDPVTKVMKKHDTFEYKGGLLNPESLAAYFPYGYEGDPEVREATFKHDMSLAYTYLGYPMLASLLGVFAAREGDRKFSLEMFERGVADYTTEPYLQFIEFLYKDITGDTAPAVTTYVANFSGFLMSCMYGLTGLQLGPGDPQSWCKHPIVMPEGWEGIEIERIWVRGKPARLIAMHGDEHARIEMLPTRR